MKGKMTLVETITSILLFSFGLLHIARGIFWLLLTESTKHESNMYMSLEALAPLYIWSVMVLLGGVMFLMASIKLPTHHISKSSAMFCLIGGLICGIFYFLFATVGFDNATNWLAPVQFIVYSASSFMLAFFGGAGIWRKRTVI